MSAQSDIPAGGYSQVKFVKRSDKVNIEQNVIITDKVQMFLTIIWQNILDRRPKTYYLTLNSNRFVPIEDNLVQFCPYLATHR